MLARPLRAIHLVVRHAEVIPRDPDDRPLRPESLVLESSLDQVVALGGRQVREILEGPADGGGGINGRVTALRVIVQVMQFLLASEIGVTCCGIVFERDW